MEQLGKDAKKLQAKLYNKETQSILSEDTGIKQVIMT